MPSTPKQKKEQIEQLAAEIARHRYELDSIPALKKLEKDYGIAKSTLIKYLKAGIENVFGKEKTINIYKEIWASKIIPKHQEIIRQRGEQLARQFTDRNSESYNDASKIPSIKELKSEFKKKGIKRGTETLQRHLEKGIERVVGTQNVLEISRKMGFHIELPLEYQEKVQQLAIKYARQFLDEKSPFFQNQKAIPSQLKIQEDLATQKIKIDVRRIVEQLKIGVLKAVGPTKANNVFKQMWPRHEIALELQEILQNKGKELHNKFTDPNSITYSDCSKLESIHKIWQDLLAKGVKISEGGVFNHIQLGVRSQVGEDSFETIWNQMYPRPERKVPIERNLTSETIEKIMEIGANWGKKFNEHSSNIIPFLKTVPKLKVIQNDLKEQGFDASLASVITYLKKGIEREAGTFSAKEIYKNLWPRYTPPIIQEMIRTEGAFFTTQFCDPISPDFHNSTNIPTLMALRKKYRKLGFDLTESAIGRYLTQGIGRVPGIISAQELFKKMWPRLDLPLEIQEKVMQKGVDCTEQLLASKELSFSKPIVFKSIYKIQKELKTEGINLSTWTIAKYLKLGVESRVGTELASIYYSEMWPETIPNKLQEKIKEIFLDDVRNLKTGNLNQIKSQNFLENELGISKKSIIKYGKIELEKAFGKTKGTELYEKRLSVFEHDELLGKCTHIIWNDVLKNALNTQGIKYYCEVKLPVPDPKLAQDYVRVDGIAVFAPRQIEQLLNKTGATGKPLYAELQLSPEIIQNAQEIALEATANIAIKNRRAKNDKYARDKDGNPIYGRIVLIISLERWRRNERVMQAPELSPNARVVNMDFVADLLDLSEKDRALIAEALRNSDFHDLVAQEALVKREGFQYSTDSDAYWLAKMGHVPDLRYWQDLTDYFPNDKETGVTPLSPPIQETRPVVGGEKGRDEGNARKFAQEKTPEVSKLENAQNTRKPSPTPEERKIPSKEIPANESGDMKPEQTPTRNAIKGESPAKDSSTRLNNTPTEKHVQNPTPERKLEEKNKERQADRVEKTLERRPGIPNRSGANGPTSRSWKKDWKLKDGVIWDPPTWGAIPPPEFLEPKKKYIKEQRLSDLFPPGPEPPDPQDAESPRSEFIPPRSKLDPDRPEQPQPPLNPDSFTETDSDGGNAIHPDDGNPFAEGTRNETPPESNSSEDPFSEGTGNEAPPESSSSEDPFSEPNERQPASGSGTWDDPFTYPPEGEFPENAGDDYDPFRADEEGAAEPPDDTDPFHDNDYPLEADGQFTGEEGVEGNDGSETEPASDDAVEGESDQPDDPNDGDASQGTSGEGGNDGDLDNGGA